MKIQSLLINLCLRFIQETLKTMSIMDSEGTITLMGLTMKEIGSMGRNKGKVYFTTQSLNLANRQNLKACLKTMKW
mgnify:FL=1